MVDVACVGVENETFAAMPSCTGGEAVGWIMSAQKQELVTVILKVPVSV